MATVINPITGFDITLLPNMPGATGLFGWVHLSNGNDSAGFIYLQSAPVKPRLGSSGYVVTGMSLDTIHLVLDQLRAGAPLQIRYDDPDPADPWVFIEPRDGPPVTASGLALPEEEIVHLT